MLMPKDIARFWAAVDRSGDCWVWTRSRKKFGYGRFMLNGKQWIATRVSWVIAFGPIPPGKHVLHACDNPPCVRPSHLFIGTNSDNVADRAAKGRSFHPFGSLSGKSKLDEAAVIAIRSSYDSGAASSTQLAAQYGVTPGLIGQIITGRIWKHVGGSVRKGPAAGERTNKNTITEAQVREIRMRRAAGEKLRAIAADYGCSEATISLAARGLTWKCVE